MILPPLLVALQSSPRLETFVIDGAVRKAQVFPGDGAAPAAGRPLVMFFHGHGGSIGSSVRNFAVHRLWSEATVVYPEGLPTATQRDPEGARRGWQNVPGENGDRDLKLVDAILAGAKGHDPRRVYAMGFSNGGAFTYLLWAERGSRFAAYGTAGASGGRSLRRVKPAPAFFTMSDKDAVASPERQRASILALAKLNGADLASGTKDGLATYAKGGVPFGTYVHEEGHAYPDGAIEATVGFFKRLAR